MQNFKVNNIRAVGLVIKLTAEDRSKEITVTLNYRSSVKCNGAPLIQDVSLPPVISGLFYSCFQGMSPLSVSQAVVVYL